MSYHDQHVSIAQELLHKATSADRAQRREGFGKLRWMISGYPTTIAYRQSLVMALAVTGSHHKAMYEALFLEALDSGTHEVEHTLAQIYLMCGDKSRAREHALKAH